MNVEVKTVSKIDRITKMASIPPQTEIIGDFACFNGEITALHAEETSLIIIGRFSFSRCFSLHEIMFPASLKEIHEGAFSFCSLLKILKFSVDSRLQKFGKRSFYKCYQLKMFEFPPFLKIIEDEAFCEYKSLRRIDLRNTKIEFIGEFAFGYNNETIILLPSTVDIQSIKNISINQIEVEESHQLIKRDDSGVIFSNKTIMCFNRKENRVFIRRGIEHIFDDCFMFSKLVHVIIPSSVITIGIRAFRFCENLEKILFCSDSKIETIKESAFNGCSSLKNINFPKTLREIMNGAFADCKSLDKVVFPSDSQLEKIISPFASTRIKHLKLPPSLKFLDTPGSYMRYLESIHINNDMFQSNEEGTAIFSRDGSEIIYVIGKTSQFDIPKCVRIIRKHAFYYSGFLCDLLIPSSVESIEDEAFFGCYFEKIEFEKGSKLKNLDPNSFDRLESLIINNENFTTDDNGVVRSKSPVGIVFVPPDLETISIDPFLEVIYSFAFFKSKIKSLKLPKSLKRICYGSFMNSQLESIEFEEGTELDVIEYYAFFQARIENMKLPLIKEEIYSISLPNRMSSIEFPSKFHPKSFGTISNMNQFGLKFIVPRSSLSTLSYIQVSNFYNIEIVEDQETILIQ